MINKIQRSCISCNQMSPMFCLLNQEELDSIDKNKFIVRFKKGEVILKQGTGLSHVISLTSGSAKLCLEGYDGKNLMLRIIKNPNFVGGPGMYFDQRHHYSMIALEDSEACFIQMNVFKQIIHANASFADAFMKDFSKNMLITYNRLINQTQKQIPGRMADALLYLANEIYDNNVIGHEISKIDLAELTGMSKDSTVRILREFTSEGLIKMKNNQIEICDSKSLEKISNVG